jgi:anti-sigma B factor antagonist
MTTLSITGEMTIYQAAEQHAQLQAALQAGAPLELNLAGVTELDTAGLQVLMMAKKAAQRDGRSLHLVAHSAAVQDVFEMLRVASYFGDPMVM